MAQECQLVKKPLGLGNCPSMPEYFRRMFTATVGWFIPAATIASGNAAILTFIQNAILTKDIYLWPQMFSSEDQSEETVYQSTPLGKRKVRDGFYEWLINFSDSLCSHKAMYTHRSTNTGVIFWDTANQLNGYLNAAGDFYPLSVQMLNTEKMKPNTGSEVAMSPVRITLADNLEFDRDGALLAMTGLNGLIPLTEVTITRISSISTAVVVEVVISCDSTPLEGLTTGDFVLLTAAGAAQTISSVTESVTIPGRYTLAGTGLVSGTVRTADPDDLSVEAYETVTPATVTI
jgi:hypothetical protein